MQDDTLRYAVRVAFNMSRDPEVESIAGEAWLKAVRTFNSELGVPLKRYIALCVKRDIWCYWRRMKYRKTAELPDAPDVQAPDEPLRVDFNDWYLLQLHYIDKVPLDVLCKWYDLSTRAIRKHIADATERYIDAYSDLFAGLALAAHPAPRNGEGS